MRSRAIRLAVVVMALLLPGTSQAPPQPIEALAPIEVVLDGHRELVGVAVDPAGSVYVSDRASGTVLTVSPRGHTEVLLSGLDRPAGLAIDGDGRLLIAEEGAGRVLRREPSGALTTLAATIKTPRWLAIAGDGSLYVSAHRLDEPDGVDVDEGRVILRVTGSGAVTVVARGLRRLEGLALTEGALVAATKGFAADTESPGALLRYLLLPDGSLGAAQQWISTGLKEPAGLVRDQVGAFYAAAKEVGAPPDASKRAVGKAHPDGRLTAFAANLDDPQGLALAPNGSLYVADGKAGRLLRFRAPAAPTLVELPAFTNAAILTVRGSTEAGARVDVTIEGGETSATAVADPAGRFSLPVVLLANRANDLSVLASAYAGDGLTGVAAEVTVIHDDVAPGVRIAWPGAGAFVRQTVTLRADATDAGSGVASVTFGLDRPVGTVPNGDPTQPLVATLSFDTTSLSDGVYPLSATAHDRAGNVASVSQAIVIDNTPPETSITEGPSGTISDTTATFTFGGDDNLTPPTSLVFAWRLDGGPWSEITGVPTVTLSALAPGSHVFEVKARDLAGNEDPSPAQSSFTVASLRVIITDPVDGARVSTGLLVVRGTVQTGGAEVGVTVNGFMASVAGSGFAVLIPATTDLTALTAVATTAAGGTVSHSVAVSVVPGAVPALAATPNRGLVPLNVRFVVVDAPTGASLEADLDGDGTLDAVMPDVGSLSFTYAQPGLYFPRVVLIDRAGSRHVMTAVVEAVDRAGVDQLVQAKWAGMRDALRRGDVDAAVQFIAIQSRDEFRIDFNSVTPFLSALAGALPDIRLVGMRGNFLEYELLDVEGGMTWSYYVEVVRDEDGVLRIAFF